MQMPFDDFWTPMSTIQEQSRRSLLRLFETSLSIFYTVSPALYPSFSVWNFQGIQIPSVRKPRTRKHKPPFFGRFSADRAVYTVNGVILWRMASDPIWWLHLCLGTLTYLYHLPFNSETSAEITYQHLSTSTKNWRNIQIFTTLLDKPLTWHGETP